MSATMFQQIVSIGPACRAKHQIQRVYGRSASKRGVFDWQTTSTDAFLEYLRRDFQGMFERSDLAVENGVVHNVRVRTGHYHDFPADMTEVQLDARYDVARSLHDRYCATTRTALRNHLPTLFVLSNPVPADVELALRDYIRHAEPAKRFHVLHAPEDGDAPSWEGTSAIWDEHFAPFQVRIPWRDLLEYRINRFIRNTRRLLPKALQPATQFP